MFSISTYVLLASRSHLIKNPVSSFFKNKKKQNSINLSFDRPERISHRTSEGLEHLLNKGMNSKHMKSLVQKRKKWYVSMNGVVYLKKENTILGRWLPVISNHIVD